MEKWLILASRAAAMGIGWGAAWIPVSLSAGRFIEQMLGLTDEPWLIAGMLAGFPCGAVFSVLAGSATERRPLDALPLKSAVALGAASGLLLGSAWLVVALLSDPPNWFVYGVIIGSLTLMSAVSGIATALLARLLKDDPRAHAA